MQLAFVDHIVIGFDEPRYYLGTLSTVIGFVMLSQLFKRLSQRSQNLSLKIFGGFAVGLILLNQFFFALSPDHGWDICVVLPFHLCSLSYILVGLNCFFRSKFLWEITLFLGIIGGIHSMFTPELTNGDGWYFLSFYYFKHGVILFVPILQYQIWKYSLDKRSWLRVFIYTNIYMVFTLFVNWGLNHFFPEGNPANYFYTWEPPDANNPLIQGEWPYYLILCDVALIVHLVLIQLGFKLLTRKNRRQ